jgi:hypothetical protein
VADEVVTTVADPTWGNWELNPGPEATQTQVPRYDLPHLCQGCDRIVAGLLMDWTESGLYRCAACRGVVVTVDPDDQGQRVWADLSERTEP